MPNAADIQWFKQQFQPAIEAAERGYLLPVVVQSKWSAAIEELHAQPGFAKGNQANFSACLHTA